MEWDREDRVERIMNSSNRIEWLDYMKGVAILIVVVGHLAHNIGGKYMLFSPIIICEMPLFFFLSGILANKITHRTIGENCKKRLQSLGIPLIVVGGVFNLCIGGIPWFLFDVYHMGFWFLLSLLTCWLMFIPLLKGIKRIFKNKSKSISLMGELLLFLPFVIYKMVYSYIPKEVDDALSLNFTFTYYRFFVVGYFIGLYYQKMKTRVTLIMSVVLTLIVMVLIITENSVLSYIPMTIQQLILSVCLAGSIYVCYKYSCSFLKKVLQRYGKGSLVIYMFHMMVIKYIDMSFLENTSEIMAFVGTLAVSMLLCEISLLAFYPIEHNKHLRKYILGKF